MAKKNKQGLLKSMSPVKKASALILSGVIVTSGLGMVRSGIKSDKAYKQLDSLDARQSQLLVGIKSDNHYMDWYEDRINTCKDALDKDIINEEQYNENIRKFSNDEYILDNISTIDYINQKYVMEKENIDRETAEAESVKASENVKGAANGVIMGVSGAGLFAVLSSHLRKKSSKVEESEKENTEEQSM